MNSLRISVASLTAATNKAQLGEVVVVHKDRAPAICRDLFKRPHIFFELFNRLQHIHQEGVNWTKLFPEQS